MARFWGINFTYATWFAVTALRAAGAGRTILNLRQPRNG